MFLNLFLWLFFGQQCNRVQLRQTSKSNKSPQVCPHLMLGTAPCPLNNWRNEPSGIGFPNKFFLCPDLCWEKVLPYLISRRKIIENLHPRKLICPPNRDYFNRGHVSFPGSPVYFPLLHQVGDCLQGHLCGTHVPSQNHLGESGIGR